MTQTLPHQSVTLFGIFPTEKGDEEMPSKAPKGFVYSKNANVNLWSSITASDGSNCDFKLVAIGLNKLLDLSDNSPTVGLQWSLLSP